jgi:hypothetical protein
MSLRILEHGVGLERKKVLYDIALREPNSDTEGPVLVLVHLRSRVADVVRLSVAKRCGHTSLMPTAPSARHCFTFSRSPS